MVGGSLCWWRDEQVPCKSCNLPCWETGTEADSLFVSPLKRVLVLSGPAGSAKTATLRVLSREMGIDIVEYKTSEGDSGEYHKWRLLDNSGYRSSNRSFVGLCVNLQREFLESVSVLLGESYRLNIASVRSPDSRQQDSHSKSKYKQIRG